MSALAEGQDIQALMQEGEELRNRLELVGRQIELLREFHADKKRAHDTLKGVQSAQPGSEILFPVGGNTFIAATLGQNETVLKGIGAEFAMPRPVEKAVEELKKEMDTIDSDLSNLTQTASRLESRYQEIMAVAQQMGVAPGPQ